MVSLMEIEDTGEKGEGYNLMFVLSTLFPAKINLQITRLNLLNHFYKSVFPKGNTRRGTVI